MKMKIKFSLFILFLLIDIIISSFDSQTNLEKRKQFYTHIETYSNNSLKLKYDKEEGLSAYANDFIPNSYYFLRIPKNKTFCSYDIFPFKQELYYLLDEIFEMYRKAQNLEKQIYKEDIFTTFGLLFYHLGNKTRILDYLEKNNLNHYLKYTKIDESIFDSFPEVLLNKAAYNKRQIERIHRDFISREDKFANFYLYVRNRIKEGPHFEVMHHWLGDLNKFKWMFGIVKSRAYTLPHNAYVGMIGEEYYTKKTMESNFMFNKHLKNGCCICTYADLFNHFQPGLGEELRELMINNEVGYLNFAIRHDFHRGEDVTYTYSGFMTNLDLLGSYGFVLRDNELNAVELKINKSNFTFDQFEICQELNCLDENNAADVLKFGRYLENNNFMNFARILFNQGKISKSKVINLLKNNQILSYQNEIQALTYSINQLSSLIENLYFKAEKNLYFIQKERLIYRSIDTSLRTKNNYQRWKNAKIDENFFITKFTFRQVIISQNKRALNNIISLTNKEVDKLKMKYLN